MRFKSKESLQMQRPQMRRSMKDLPQLFCHHASRGCQVDDLKEAVRSEAGCSSSLFVLV